MNNKQAKFLRKVVGFVPSTPREYKDTVVKTVMVPTTRLDADGNAIMMPQQRVVRTNTGLRKAYQLLKRS